MGKVNTRIKSAKMPDQSLLGLGEWTTSAVILLSLVVVGGVLSWALTRPSNSSSTRHDSDLQDRPRSTKRKRRRISVEEKFARLCSELYEIPLRPYSHSEANYMFWQGMSFYHRLRATG